MPPITPVSVAPPSFVKIDAMSRIFRPSALVAISNLQGTNLKVHLSDGTTHTVSRRFRFDDFAAEVGRAIGAPLLRLRAHGVVGTLVYVNLLAVLSFGSVPGGLALYTGGLDPLILPGFLASDVESAFAAAGNHVASIAPASEMVA